MERKAACGGARLQRSTVWSRSTPAGASGSRALAVVDPLAELCRCLNVLAPRYHTVPSVRDGVAAVARDVGADGSEDESCGGVPASMTGALIAQDAPACLVGAGASSETMSSKRARVGARASPTLARPVLCAPRAANFLRPRVPLYSPATRSHCLYMQRPRRSARRSSTRATWPSTASSTCGSAGSSRSLATTRPKRRSCRTRGPPTASSST